MASLLLPVKKTALRAGLCKEEWWGGQGSPWSGVLRRAIQHVRWKAANTGSRSLEISARRASIFVRRGYALTALYTNSRIKIIPYQVCRMFHGACRCIVITSDVFR